MARLRRRRGARMRRLHPVFFESTGDQGSATLAEVSYSGAQAPSGTGGAGPRRAGSHLRVADESRGALRARGTRRGPARRRVRGRVRGARSGDLSVDRRPPDRRSCTAPPAGERSGAGC